MFGIMDADLKVVVRAQGIAPHINSWGELGHVEFQSGKLLRLGSADDQQKP